MPLSTRAKVLLGIAGVAAVAGVATVVAKPKKKKKKVSGNGAQTPLPEPTDPTDPTEPPRPPGERPGGIQPPPPPPTEPPPIGTPPTPPPPPPTGPGEIGGVEVPPMDVDVFQMMPGGTPFCTGGTEHFAAVVPRVAAMGDSIGEGSILLEFCATAPVRYANEYVGPSQDGGLCTQGDDWIRAEWPEDPSWTWCLRIEPAI